MANKVDALPEVEAAPELPGFEASPEGFDEGLAWKRVSFRGTVYKLVELSIGEYDKIEKSATETREDAQGNEIETINETMRDRMMLQKCIVEPRSLVVANLGTRLYLNLRRVMQELHYFLEPDALRAPKSSKNGTGEDTPKGN